MDGWLEVLTQEWETIVALFTLALFIICWTAFGAAITGRATAKYPVGFDGWDGWLVTIGRGRSGRGDYLLFCHLPIRGWAAFWATLRDHPRLMSYWLLGLSAAASLGVIALT